MKVTTKVAPWAAVAFLLVALGAAVESRFPSSIEVRSREATVNPKAAELDIFGAGAHVVRSYTVDLGGHTGGEVSVFAYPYTERRILTWPDTSRPRRVP